MLIKQYMFYWKPEQEVYLIEQVLFKKKYTIREFYRALYKGLHTFKDLRMGKKSGRLSNHFVERIMLAVTEVNGCEVCSYAHTKIALEQGMDEKEIKGLLSGTASDIPEDEMLAILFAQHYADTKGNPTEESWNRILAAYGEQTALGILGATRLIMAGNIYGLAMSALKSRIKGRPVKGFSFTYEAGMLISAVPFLPAAVIHAFILKRMQSPMIQFEPEKAGQGTLTN